MKNYSGKTLLIAVTAFIVLNVFGFSVPAFASPKKQVAITVFHTNDTHGAGLDVIPGSASPAWRYSQIPALKADAPNTVLIDAGDFAHGGIFASLTHGLAAMNAMRLLGYDAVALGNHDFYGDSDTLMRRLMNRAGTDDFNGSTLKGNPVPVVNANVRKPGSELDTRYPLGIIIKRDGVRIGIFGLTTCSSYVTAGANAKTYNFQELTAASKAAVSFLKGKRADIIIAVAHAGGAKGDDAVGADTSASIAKNVPGIDLIIDAHDHENRMGDNAVTIGNTLIVETGAMLASIGRVDIVYDRRTKELVSMTSTELKSTRHPDGHALAGQLVYPEDETVKAYLDPIAKAINDEFDKEIAKSSMALYGGNYVNGRQTASVARRGQTNVSDLIADARRHAAEQFFKGTEHEALKVIALTCGGGVRDSLPQGSISLKNVMSLFLSGGTGGSTYVKVKGKILWEIVEWGLSTITGQNATTGAISADGGTHGRFPNFAGLGYVYDLTKPAARFDDADYGNWSKFHQGSRVQSITLDDGTQITPESGEWYIVITSSYEMGGGDGYFLLGKALADGNLIELGENDAGYNYDATVQWIRKIYAETGDVYYPLNTGKVTTIGPYTGANFTSVITAVDSAGAVIPNRRVELHVNYGKIGGVEWNKIGDYTTNNEGQFSATLLRGPQELKLVLLSDSTSGRSYTSRIMYVDNLAGLVNSTHAFSSVIGDLALLDDDADILLADSDLPIYVSLSF